MFVCLWCFPVVFCLVCLRILECVKEIRTNQLMPGNAWKAKLSIVLFHQYLADLMYLLFGKWPNPWVFKPAGTLRCEAWRWSFRPGSLPRWGLDFLLSWTMWVEPLSTFAIWLHHWDLHAKVKSKTWKGWRIAWSIWWVIVKVIAFFSRKYSSTKKDKKMISPKLILKKTSPATKKNSPP